MPPWITSALPEPYPVFLVKSLISLHGPVRKRRPRATFRVDSRNAVRYATSEWISQSDWNQRPGGPTTAPSSIGFGEGRRMRTGLVSLVGLIGVLALAAHDGAETVLPKRYGLELDSKTYPQSTPKEALASLLKAVDARRVDYVLAQLANPDWVDRRVKESGGGFPALVEESTARLVGNHVAVKKPKRSLSPGAWKM